MGNIFDVIKFQFKSGFMNVYFHVFHFTTTVMRDVQSMVQNNFNIALKYFVVFHVYKQYFVVFSQLLLFILAVVVITFCFQLFYYTIVRFYVTAMLSYFNVSDNV